MIILKLNYKISSDDALRITAAVAAAKRSDARLIYFDGNDDLCIQWPKLLEYVDLYVKRHVFRDRSKYLGRTIGPTNLVEYVSHQFGSSSLDGDTSMSDPVRPEHLEKIHCGMTFGMDETMLALWQHGSPALGQRQNDIICRANIPGNWMGFLRQPVISVLKRMAEAGWKVITPEKRVSQEIYNAEMLNSKACVSPFGYGEICYRDYEAVIFGCLLVKPDMSHVEAYPDIFRAGETYLPVAWDYSDLPEKLEAGLRDQEGIARMTTAASKVLSDAYREEWFLERICAMLNQAGIKS